MTLRTFETVASFRDVLDAELARSKLLSEGIDVELVDCATIGVVWNYSNALGGVKVQVASSQVDRAVAVLGRDESAVLEEIDARLGSRTSCPNCNCEIVEEVNNTRRLAAWFMLFGIPLVWFDKHSLCKGCGHRW